jgi:UDP-N-acetylglucosamine--N-acetylmuramyl-(pentapeptide) pyrophosphoryl-undecaprenol N-acetylglucosamine transferase
LYPGIALARELKRRDPATQVSFVGTAQGIEARVVPREGFELDLIHVTGLKGKTRVERMIGFGLLPLSAVDAMRVIAKRRPDVVVGVGGFASGPVLALASVCRYPTMLLEQNALPGITNRLLAHFVRASAVNFEAALAYFPGTGFVAGNPVRPEFFPAQNEEANDRSSEPRDAARVLAFGGSQGSHAINVAVVEAASRLAASGVRLAITHQTGERDLDLVRNAYQRAGLEARVEAFIYQIDGEMKAADLVICRAGATTLAELAASETPSILVPLPNSTDDHQRKNAEVFARSGAALVIEERELQASLGDAMRGVLESPDRRRQMSAAAKSLARRDAAERIADRVETLALRLDRPREQGRSRSGQAGGRDAR